MYKNMYLSLMARGVVSNVLVSIPTTRVRSLVSTGVSIHVELSFWYFFLKNISGLLIMAPLLFTILLAFS